MGALLALALAAAAAEPCRATDALGRSFPVCFDPGNRVELSAAGAGGGREPAVGGALDLGAALRWRRDLRAPDGRLEWMLDQSFAEARALFAGGATEPVAARALLWRGTFLRHREQPFLFVPGPRPRRLPFPFDVGLLVEVGGAEWEKDRPRDVRALPLRSALLLDVAGHGRVRRLSFGPEVAWGVHVVEHRATIHELVPFTGGALDVRLESASGLLVLGATVHGGSLVSVPGGSEGFVEGRLDLERTVVAVNDRPLALFVAALGRGGGLGRAAEVSVGIRVVLPR